MGMNNPSRHIRSFSLRYYEMNRFGEATPLTLLSLLEETAFSHCDAVGWDVYRLRKEGFGWILLGGTVDIARYPTYREAFTLETWLSASRLFHGQRDYLLRGSAGETIGTARSWWVFYDLERRRPVRILDPILKAWAPNPEGSVDRLPEVSAPSPDRMDGTRAYDVRLNDIDTNGHVNNVNYLEWALESVPQSVQDDYMLSSISGRYIHEVRYGERIRPAFGETPTSGGSSHFSHAVFAEKAEEKGEETAPVLVAAAETSWKPRASRDSSRSEPAA
jgi:medium-chain acyl-[acyl-carrier-protein] hydrolase